MNENDLRVLKTKKAIHEAFLSLLKKKKLDKITVKELCQKAVISKGTFYLHYTDIYDLYRQEVYQIFVQMVDDIDDIGQLLTDPERFIAEFLQNSQKSLHTLQTVLQQDSEFSYMYKFSELICDRIFATGQLVRTPNTEMRLQSIVNTMLYMLPKYGNIDFQMAAAFIKEMVDKLL